MRYLNEKCKNIAAVILLSLLLALSGCGNAEQISTSSVKESSETRSESESKTEPATESAKPTMTESETEKETESKETTPESSESTEEMTETIPETTPEEPSSEEAEKVHVVCGCLSETQFQLWLKISNDVKDKGVDLEVKLYDMLELMKAQESGEVDITLVSGPYSEDSVQKPIGYFACQHWDLYSKKYKSVEELIAAHGTVGLLPGVYVYRSSRLQKILSAAGLAEFSREVGSYMEEEDIQAKVELIPRSDHDISALDEYDAAFFYYVENMEPIFLDPTVEDPASWISIAAFASLTEDPVMLDAFEKIVAAFQTQETMDLYYGNRSTMRPAGWDVDLISQYRK